MGGRAVAPDVRVVDLSRHSARHQARGPHRHRDVHRPPSGCAAGSARARGSSGGRRADGPRLLRGGRDHVGPVGRADGLDERECRALHPRARGGRSALSAASPLGCPHWQATSRRRDCPGARLMSLLVILVFLAIAVLGMPLAFALGTSAVAGLIASDVDFNLLPTRMMNAVNAFPLMSIPFFILAGELMLKAGMMERIIDLANAVVGRVRGGLAHVTMLAGLGLSAVADASALGSTLIPSLRKVYGVGFSSAVVAAAANLGPIIPPSGAMIVYAFMAGPTVSVGGMFMAGVIPGLILVALMMGACSVIAVKRNYPLTGDSFSLARIGHELKRSIIIFLMPVVVIGGIIGGAFTATEGSAIAVVYALAVGFFVTRKLKLSDLPRAAVHTAIVSAVVGAMIAFASVVTYMLTLDLLPQKLSSLIQSLTSSPIVYMLLVAAVLFVVGMFLESNAAYIMLVPLLHPIALKYGIDPLLFGFLFVFNLVIGMLTPPVGVVLFVLCGITGLKLGELTRHVLPFILIMYGLLFVCMFFPPLLLTVPRLLGY